MQKLRIHIAGLFLLLTASFSFPVSYWHDCEHHSDEHMAESQGPQLEEAHPDCLLCDYESPVYSDMRLSIPLSGNAEPIVEKSFVGLQTEYFLYKQPQLRGPPS
ncbi:MAG: hypothetical protein AAFP02_05135 [Bacteroidota bacterium]